MHLNLPALPPLFSQVIIDSVRGGSVIVEFSILRDANGTAFSVDALTAALTTGLSIAGTTLASGVEIISAPQLVSDLEDGAELAAETQEILPLSGQDVLTTLTLVRADGGVVVLGRSYDGNGWEAVLGPDVPLVFDCAAETTCTVSLPATSSADDIYQIRVVNTNEDIPTEELFARSLLQATFGETALPFRFVMPLLPFPCGPVLQVVSKQQCLTLRCCPSNRLTTAPFPAGPNRAGIAEMAAMGEDVGSSVDAWLQQQLTLPASLHRAEFRRNNNPPIPIQVRSERHRLSLRFRCLCKE